MKQFTVENNGVKKVTTINDITLDEVKMSEFQKAGTISAQIRQLVGIKSHYPAKKVTNSMQNNIFDAAEFGFDEKVFDSEENRLAWLPVPVSMSKEEILKRIAAANANGAIIYKVLSNSPILSDEQKYAISNGDRTMDDFANSQVARYPEGAVDRVTGEDISGQLILDTNGRVQYRRTFFWKTSREDVDMRSKEAPYYLSAELQAELDGAEAVQGQTI